MEEDTKKRIRRSSYAIERAILTTLKEQVERVGFENITVNKLIEGANIEPRVFYNRFENIESLLDFFAQKYDFWFTEISGNHNVNIDNKEEYYRQTLNDLAVSLYKNKVMQKLLLWELSEDNLTTKRATMKREDEFEELNQYLDNYFSASTGVDIRVMTALLIGGIYFMVLHKDRSTFCGVDFSSKEGKSRMLKALDVFTSAIFGFIDNEKEISDMAQRMATEMAHEMAIEKTTKMAVEVAKKMKSKGMSMDDIIECTLLPKEIIEAMY